MNELRAFLKFVSSFRKSVWTIADYPLLVREQHFDPNEVFQPPRFGQPRFSASIIYWPLLCGLGDSREKALADLDQKFVARVSSYREQGKGTPRPGTEAPVEFASQTRVNAYPELAQDFLKRILDLDDAWISDESSLWDFHCEQDNDALFHKIHETYAAKVDDLSSAKLCDIFDRIAESSIQWKK